MSLEAIHIAEIDETHTRVTASPHAAELFKESSPWGFVYHRVLGSLGIELETDEQSANLSGEISVVRDHIIAGSLAWQIADLAQASGRLMPYDFQKESQEKIALRELHRLTTRTLPELLEATTNLSGASARVTTHLGYALLAPRGARISTSSSAKVAA